MPTVRTAHVGKTRGTVLIVQEDEAERRRLTDCLRVAGFLASSCPGPSSDLDCPLDCGNRACAKALGCDLIVLDPATKSEDTFEGASPFDLLAAYVAEDKPIVLTTRSTTGVRPYLGEQVRVVSRPASPDELLAAIRDLLPGR